MSCWYVIHTRANAEKKACQALSAGGIEVFLPLYTTIRQWSDRKKKVELPLIPGMIFVRLAPENHSLLYEYPMVTGILKEFGKAAIVRDEELHNLRIIAREWSGENIEKVNTTDFTPGDYVAVKRGRLKGLQGCLVEIKGKHRLVIQIEPIATSFVVNLPVSQVEKITPVRT